MRKLSFRFGLVAALFAAGGPVSHAQPTAYPNRPIRFIVPYSIGGTSDLLARLVGAKLTEELGQQFVVDNRGGGGSTLGTALAAAANPDGYTIIVNNVGLAVNETLQLERSYDALKDLAPIALIGITPHVLMVNNAMPVKSVADFVALAKSQPGKIAFGSGGNGSSTHVSVVLLQKMAKIQLLHVPYKGGGPAVRDAIAGHVQFTLSPIPTIFGHLKAGRLRALGVSSAKRSPTLPELPTIAESGVPGYEFSTWFGLLAPAGTPKAIITRLNQATVKGLNASDLREKLQSQGVDPQPTTPAEFGKLLRSEIKRWREVIEWAGITKQ
ncbi:MAG: tripartite tricarboxylate transporter substrate binding protein [Betaproteobacteria bacterium]|nr:tripartite tricarboxylate transporter substrate binding protein [Betaproteobacteria bacterium]